MDVWMKGWMDACMNGCMDERMDGWMLEWMLGWMKVDLSLQSQYMDAWMNRYRWIMDGHD